MTEKSTTVLNQSPEAKLELDNVNAENNEDAPKRNESLEATLRKFKRQSSGIISEIRKREAYDKPSVKRKKKSS